jgi:COMPASS component SWD3
MTSYSSRSELSESPDPKRRRVADSPNADQSPESHYSSADEHIDHDRGRRSSTRSNDYAKSRHSSENGNHSDRLGKGNEDTIHTFYRRSSDIDSRDRSRSRSESRETSEDEGDELRADEVEAAERELEAQEEARNQAEAEAQAPKPKPFKPYSLKLLLKGHKRGVAAVKISPDGRWIASCSADATIRIWDAATGKVVHILEAHLAGISTISWSPDSTIIASGSDDKSIRLWNALTVRIRHTTTLQDLLTSTG